MIAALYVEDDGTYFGLPGVDPWPQSRDARLYAGPYPVVAHPPCERWGAMAKVNFVRWGGEHNRPGNDGGCFKSALGAVRQWGGVLEHPAKTRAWAAFGLPKPTSIGWQRVADGWVCEVWQSAYGHLANKATWLKSATLAMCAGLQPKTARKDRAQDGISHVLCCAGTSSRAATCFQNWTMKKARQETMAKPDDPHRQIMWAAKRGHGLHLSAEAVRFLSLDGAIETRANYALETGADYRDMLKLIDKER